MTNAQIAEALKGLRERLSRKHQVLPPQGGAGMSADGKWFSYTTDAGLRHVNPDGPAIADELDQIIAALAEPAGDVEAVAAYELDMEAGLRMAREHAHQSVEKVARAICKSRGHSPNSLYQHNFEGDWPEDERREYVDAITGESRTMLFHRAWRRYEKAARAAIAAMGGKDA